MFQTISKPVISQAYHIAKEDADVAGSIIAMAYQAYENAQKRGKTLSVGELVNFMKHRANDLKHGNRLHMGSVSKQISKDVYSPRNYLSGEVEVFSLELKEEDDDKDYTESILTSRDDWSDNVIFQIGMEGFLNTISKDSRKLITLRNAGYRYSEIAKIVKSPVHVIKSRLKEAAKAFIQYFELPNAYMVRYGLN